MFSYMTWSKNLEGKRFKLFTPTAKIAVLFFYLCHEKYNNAEFHMLFCMEVSARHYQIQPEVNDQLRIGLIFCTKTFRDAFPHDPK